MPIPSLTPRGQVNGNLDHFRPPSAVRRTTPSSAIHPFEGSTKLIDEPERPKSAG